MGEHGVYVAKLCYELRGGLLTDTWTAGEVVGRVAHERQEVDDLGRGVDAIFCCHLFGPHLLVASTVAWTEDEDVGCHELTIVFVGREHVGLYACGAGFRGERAYHVVGLEAVGL